MMHMFCAFHSSEQSPSVQSLRRFPAFGADSERLPRRRAPAHDLNYYGGRLFCNKLVFSGTA